MNNVIPTYPIDDRLLYVGHKDDTLDKMRKRIERARKLSQPRTFAQAALESLPSALTTTAGSFALTRLLQHLRNDKNKPLVLPLIFAIGSGALDLSAGVLNKKGVPRMSFEDALKVVDSKR